MRSPHGEAGELQTNKKLLGKNGEGVKFLTEFKT
jgi:hypothetical protein